MSQYEWRTLTVPLTNTKNACDRCGVELQVGQWPWCPHEDARNFGEAPLEPYVDHNLGPEPVEIRTRGERRAIMSRNHLEYNDVSKKLRGRLYVDLHRRG